MQSQALLKGKSIKVMGVQNTGLSSKSTTRSSSSPAPKGQVWKSVTAFNDVLNNINAPRKKRKRKVPPPCGLPCYSYLERTPNAQLYYIWETHEANIVLERSSLCSQNISGKNRVYMGFDMEWAPVHQKGVPQNPVALIQLATEYEIFLLQIYRMEEFPHKLAEILYNKNIIKVGVSILNDCQKLFRDYSVSVRSCLELSYLARSVESNRWTCPFNNLISLQRLVQAYEMRDLPKGGPQLSNWAAPLDKVQVHYAANDAHCAYMIVQQIESKARALDLSARPDPLYFIFHFINGTCLNLNGEQWQRPGPVTKEKKPDTDRDTEKPAVVT